MKIIHSDIDDLTINSITTLRKLVLNLKSDCEENSIHNNNINLRTNVDTLLKILRHPLTDGLVKDDVELGELLGVKIIPYKEEYRDTVCAYHEGVILDTILFYI